MAEQKTAIKTESKSGSKTFVTRHNGDFFAGEIEFKKGVPVELTSEQQEIYAVASSIKNGMLKAV